MGNDQLLPVYNVQLGICDEYIAVYDVKQYASDMDCFQPLIGTMFKDYEQRAGIERRAFDGKGFHGLRRRLAKKLLVTGTSLPVIAQILGHENVQSARQYLALDTNNLMECALDFSGIPTERRELQ